MVFRITPKERQLPEGLEIISVARLNLIISFRDIKGSFEEDVLDDIDIALLI